MANPDAMNFENWRVLTIQPHWLSQILTYKKVWELRKTNSQFRGYLAFAASRTSMIWGIGRLSKVTWMPQASAAVAKHCVTPNDVNTYTSNGGCFVWELTDVKCFQSPLRWEPKPGSVIFSRVTPCLHEQIWSVPVHDDMDTALASPVDGEDRAIPVDLVARASPVDPVALCGKMWLETSKLESHRREIRRELCKRKRDDMANDSHDVDSHGHHGHSVQLLQ